MPRSEREIAHLEDLEAGDVEDADEGRLAVGRRVERAVDEVDDRAKHLLVRRLAQARELVDGLLLSPRLDDDLAPGLYLGPQDRL